MSNQSSIQDKGESECLSIIENMNENLIEAATDPSGINKDDLHFDLSQSSNISTQSGPSTKTMPNKDSNVLPAPRVRTRGCFLCGQKGHGQFKCPRMMNYGTFPLPEGDRDIRLCLANNILDVHYYNTYVRDINDHRPVMKSFPKSRIPGLIIHKRFLINKDLICSNPKDNLCVECTFLEKGGDENLQLTKTLFCAKDVSWYIQKTKSNLIVSLLHRPS